MRYLHFQPYKKRYSKYLIQVSHCHGPMEIPISFIFWMDIDKVMKLNHDKFQSLKTTTIEVENFNQSIPPTMVWWKLTKSVLVVFGPSNSAWLNVNTILFPFFKINEIGHSVWLWQWDILNFGSTQKALFDWLKMKVSHCHGRRM